jgi:tetratricopeptide (TPR) repeat protein
MRTNLAQSRAVNLVPTSGIVAALQRMQRPATARLALPLARELAVREGVKAVVSGSVASAGEGFIITARLVGAESGDELAVYQESAANAGEIIPAVDKLTRALRGKIGESLKAVHDAPALAQVTTRSIDALRAFVAGLRANDVEGDYPKAIPLFEEAIRRDSNFASAYVQLAYTLGNAGLQQRRQDSLMTSAYRLRDRLPERERYNVEGAYFFRKHDRPKAIAAYEREVAIDSFDVDGLNTLAILYIQTRQLAQADRLYRRALSLEPDNGIVAGNLANSLAAQGKFGAADSILREVRARAPSFPIEGIEIGQLVMRDELDSAESRSRTVLRGANSAAARNALRYLVLITEMRGRLRESDSLRRELQSRSIARGASVDPNELAANRAQDDAGLRGERERAVAELDASVRAHPPGAASPPGALLNVAFAYAVAGAPARARPFLTQYDELARDSVDRQLFRGQRGYTEGMILLAEQRTDDAIRTFRRMDVDADGLPISCSFCLPLTLGRAYDQANQADSTIANLERYLSIYNAGRINADAWFRPALYKRLGELYEAKGDTKRAVEHYAAFVELWKHADPDLQPKVAEVRARLDRLRRTLPQ